MLRWIWRDPAPESEVGERSWMTGVGDEAVVVKSFPRWGTRTWGPLVLTENPLVEGPVFHEWDQS